MQQYLLGRSPMIVKNLHLRKVFWRSILSSLKNWYCDNLWDSSIFQSSMLPFQYLQSCSVNKIDHEADSILQKGEIWIHGWYLECTRHIFWGQTFVSFLLCSLENSLISFFVADSLISKAYSHIYQETSRVWVKLGYIYLIYSTIFGGIFTLFSTLIRATKSQKD